MVTLRPVRRALVPVDAAAATRISAPNYDEFQGDDEIRAVLAGQPDAVLQVTMSHCSPHATGELEEGGPEALALAGENMKRLRDSGLTRELEDIAFVYELDDPRRGGVRQIGLGGMGLVREIRTDKTPDGTIIRNEGVRAEKAKGRADLIQATRSFIGVVNNAVDDADGALLAALAAAADARPCDYETTAEDGVTHRVWLLTEPKEIDRFAALLAAEPQAYVADGNHRSAAAAMLGYEAFLTVFFPVGTMGLAPYNRLVKLPDFDLDALLAKAAAAFDIEPIDAPEGYQPDTVHRIGLYADGRWFRLTPKPGSFDPDNAVQCIDADIVQRHVFSAALGIHDAADKRLTFVGGNRDVKWLTARVDAGKQSFAVTLAPVTPKQFVEVCRQNRIMPPKSTWFQPKIRSGLVMALL